MADRTGPPPPAPEPLRVETVDTHCHLDAMGVPVTEVVATARAVGIRRMVTVGDTMASSRWCAATAAEHRDVYAAVAVHPNETADFTDADADELASLAALPHVRAVGETGLDYYWGRVDPDVQKAAFRRHIEIAKLVDKALVIHDRDAHDDVLRILDDIGAPTRTVFHCFSGDVSMSRHCAERGYYMSFAGTVTFKNANELRAAAAAAPLELMLVETDAPFLTPVPFRGRPNAPYLVPLTVRALADVKGVHEDEIARATAANAERVFGPW
ncbi:MAG: TatD DNase family protein [Actinomycetota bacterium]|nr:TatD DNase family protein [Actinomycetota bacterium]